MWVGTSAEYVSFGESSVYQYMYTEAFPKALFHALHALFHILNVHAYEHLMLLFSYID